MQASKKNDLNMYSSARYIYTRAMLIGEIPERDKEAQPVLGLHCLSRTEWVRRSSYSTGKMLFSCPKTL